MYYLIPWYLIIVTPNTQTAFCLTIDAMEAIFREIKERYAKADDNGKREIQGYIRELQVDFYTDWDVIMRLTSGVRPTLM